MPDFSALTPNVIVGAFATIVILLGVRGLAPHLFQPRRREAFHLAMAFVLVLIGGAGRTIYWDLLRTVVGPEQWSYIRDFFGGIYANTLWNGILLWGGLHLLKLLHLILPLSERRRYSMWTAWNYPVHLRNAVYLLRRNNRRDGDR